MSLPIFFATVLGFYIAVNAYLLARLFVTLAGTGAVRFLATLLLLLLSLSFPAGQILSRRMPGRLSEILIFIGSLYLAPMIYGFLLTAAADILRLLNFVVKLTPYPPPYTTGGRVSMAAAVASLSLLISLAGAFNASMPTAKYLSLDVSLPGGATEKIRIVALSDIHLGRFVTNRHLTRLVNLTNRQKPDVVLLVGDTMDDLEWMDDPAARERTASLLRSLDAGMGVWAVPGNHDYYVGVERVAQFMNEAGTTLLRDGWATPQDRLLLIGRDDRTLERMEGKNRRPLSEIRDDAVGALGEKFAELPMIVLDHQPIALEDAQNAGATLQLSGHTHRGQLFPANFIVGRLYEKLYGEYRKGGTHYYISSGAGTWGPPVRTTGRPEIVVIDLRVMPGHNQKNADEGG